MSRYLVYYDHQNIVRKLEAPKHWGVAAIKDGFWLDENLMYCVASKSKIFIPYHKVLWIEKIK